MASSKRLSAVGVDDVFGRSEDPICCCSSCRFSGGTKDRSFRDLLYANIFAASRC
jgi:hypothetical protein